MAEVEDNFVDGTIIDETEDELSETDSQMEQNQDDSTFDLDAVSFTVRIKLIAPDIL